MGFKWLKTTLISVGTPVFSFKIALERRWSKKNQIVMKIIYLTIISILIVALITLLVFSNDFITVNNSNTSVRVNVMRAIYIESGGKVAESKENGTKTKKRIRCHISKFMLELYENNKTGMNNSNADVVRSVVPKHADSFSGHADMMDNLAESHLLIFDLPETSEDEIFTYAELKILTIIEKRRDNEAGIEKKISLFVYDEVQQEFLNAHVLRVHHSNDTWLSFNLTDQVAQALNNTKTNAKNLKIVITLSPVVSLHIQQENKLKLSLLPPRKDDFDHDYPILILSYISNSSRHQDERMKLENGTKRKKRFIDEDYEEESNSIWDDLVSRKTYEKKLKRIRNICKRKSLYVDFAEINYDEWIVQPRGYEAFQCQGKCFYPVADHLSPTKHAIIQTLLHSVAPSMTPRPCCVPTSLDSISILYIDNKGVLTYRYAYKDMVVQECGCR
ncbi:bone morphogenetic protein 10-like [Coccinella septempunctata]|uniref:bone morphogenetic protein 10-like n=1 Tax=Coccinella septempunctata TaxID=41139 RepID=UPI001D088881|nr:bone morphogenetic protein 10-like [Coccinella septempunctata]